MKVEIHGKICDGIKDTYKAKNADYGNSFAKVRKEYPEAICIRLMDKLERLKVLVAGNEQRVKDESIEDTLLDMANYCIMEVVERRLGGMRVPVPERTSNEVPVVDVEAYVKALFGDETARDHAEHYWENRR